MPDGIFGRNDSETFPRMRLVCLLVLLTLPPVSGQAQGLEQTGLYWEHCGGCHDGAGALARKSLDLVDGVLRGRRGGTPLRDFLPGHVRKLSLEEVRVIESALLRVAQGKGRFQERCGICHRSAEDLARHHLILADGVLRGRYSGRDIGEFLASHGTRSGEEADFFHKVLRRWAPPGRP